MVSPDLGKVVVVGVGLVAQARLVDRLAGSAVQHRDGRGMDHAPDARAVSGCKEVARARDVDRHEPVAVTASLVAVPEMGRRVKEYVVAGQTAGEPGDVAHVANRNPDLRQVAELRASLFC